MPRLIWISTVERDQEGLKLSFSLFFREAQEEALMGVESETVTFFHTALLINLLITYSNG
jgi:hypothetical protein